MTEVRGWLRALWRTDERGLLAVLGLLFLGTVASLLSAVIGTVALLLGVALLRRIVGTAAFRRYAATALFAEAASAALSIGVGVAPAAASVAAALAGTAAALSGVATVLWALALRHWFSDRAFPEITRSWTVSAVLVGALAVVAAPLMWWLETVGWERALELHPVLLASALVAALVPTGHVLLSLARSRAALRVNLDVLESERAEGGSAPADR